jgi:hypothetical protein
MTKPDLGRSPMATRDEVAAYIQKKRSAGTAYGVAGILWRQDELNTLWSGGLDVQPTTPSPDDVQALAREFYADAEFRALQLATFLNSPDGKLIAEAVGFAVPLGPEYDLWLAAMRRAAEMQYTEGAKPAGRFALAMTAMVVGLFILGSLFGDDKGK